MTNNNDLPGGNKKDPLKIFKDFVERLESIDELPEEITPSEKDFCRRYVNQLIQAYGLPDDPVTRETFIEIMAEFIDVQIYLNENILLYISAIVSELQDRGYDASIIADAAFQLGVAFAIRKNIDMEEIPADEFDDYEDIGFDQDEDNNDGGEEPHVAS